MIFEGAGQISSCARAAWSASAGVRGEVVPLRGRRLLAFGRRRSDHRHRRLMFKDPLRSEARATAAACRSRNVGAFMFGAQAVEVEVDEVTGKVEVVGVWSRARRRQGHQSDSVEGQIQGGLVQGAGYALTEEMVWDGGRSGIRASWITRYRARSTCPMKFMPIIVGRSRAHSALRRQGHRRAAAGRRPGRHRQCRSGSSRRAGSPNSADIRTRAWRA